MLPGNYLSLPSPFYITFVFKSLTCTPQPYLSYFHFLIETENRKRPFNDLPPSPIYTLIQQNCPPSEHSILPPSSCLFKDITWQFSPTSLFPSIDLYPQYTYTWYYLLYLKVLTPFPLPVTLFSPHSLHQKKSSS